MQLRIASATQWLIHGAADDTVPPFFSRNYTEQKKKRGENVHYLEISTAGHSDLIDPRSNAWPKVEGTVLHLTGVVKQSSVVSRRSSAQNQTPGLGSQKTARDARPPSQTINRGVG